MKTIWIPAAAGLLSSLACAGGASTEVPDGVFLSPAPVATGDLAISPDLEHALHASREAGACVVLLDGKPLAQDVEAIGPMGFLPDGTPHVAYRQARGWFQLVGGRRLGPYEALGEGFVAAGGHGAFQAKRSGRWHTVVDAQEGAGWELTSPALLTPTGHAAWLGLQDGRTVVLKDGRELAVADEVLLKHLSDDGRLAWAGREGRAWRVHVDEEALPGRWDRVGHVALGTSWAYTAQDARGWWVVTEGARHGPFADTGPVRFAPDGRLVWFEGRDEGWRLHVGDWAGPLVAEIGDTSPVFDGQRFVWWSRDAGGASVRLGDEVVSHVADVGDLAPWFAAGRPAFVGRGAEGWQVHVGDWHSRVAAEVARAVSSPDGSHVAIVLRDADGWGVDVYSVGTDAPLGSWRAPVASDRGGGVRFVEHAVWFTAVEGNRVVRREISLGPEA